MSSLHQKYYKELFKPINEWCKRKTNSLHDAMVLTNDIFLKLATRNEKQLKKIEGKGSVKNYLIVIGINLLKDKYKAKKSKPQIVSFEEVTRADILYCSDIQDQFETEEIKLHNSKYILKNISRYITNSTNRSIYIQKAINNYTYKKIREELLKKGVDLSINAIKKRKERISEEFKEKIMEEYPNFLTKKITIK